MKWYGIVVFLVIIGGLVGIVYLGVNTDNSISKIIDEPVPKIIINEQITVYNCEKNVAEYSELVNLINPNESIASKSPERIAVYEKEEELLNQGCKIQ